MEYGQSNIERLRASALDRNKKKSGTLYDTHKDEETNHYYSVKTDRKPDLEKIRGCIFGVLVGDALGARYEFLESYKVIGKIKEDIKVSKSQMYPDILGGGFFNVEPGQITDDSEMTICLLKSLSVTKKYNQKDVAKRYIDWYQTRPVDIGRSTKASLHTREIAIDNEDMIKNSLEMNITSLSNGCLMRISPLGLFSSKFTLEDTKSLINKECDLTHPNTICKDACYCYSLTIKFILEGMDKIEVYKKVINLARIPRVKIILRDAEKCPEPIYIIKDFGEETYVNTDDKKYQGYIGVALQNTFYEFLNGNDYDTSMMNILKRGGDTDTNLAIAGGILGCYYSLKSINKDWVQTVINNSKNIKRYQNYSFLSPDTVDELIDNLFP